MNSEKAKRTYRSIMLVIVVALVTFIITSVFMYNKFSTDKSYYISQNTILNAKINSIKKMLQKEYLGEIDENKLLESAVKGYVEGLDDEYTEYFTKEEMEDFKTETEGEYVGIGIYMTKNVKKNQIIVVAPIKNSPAEEAGIKSGDVIKKVDDKEYTADDFDDVAKNIKGKEGTQVKIEVQRDKETLSFDIKRKKVELYKIESEILDNNIGYINMPSFDDGCAKEFKSNYEKLKKENIKSLIVDLRNNGGGIVGEALEIIDSIVDKNSTMLITVNKNGNEEIEKSKKNSSINIPIVILVNENTASASEIFASALKENNKAKIVGVTTYGKGVIQELVSLGDGSGIKITTEEYYTPNRNKINKKGIEPDVEVKLPKNIKNEYSVERKDDTQLKKAIELLK